MLTGPVIVVASFVYVGLLFAIAHFGDKRADAGRSIIANPYIYALSLAVYCTSWTFYGSVGRAATSGIGFLPIYLGPTLMVILWWHVMLKMIRISKANRITSIADFIASRYGNSQLLGGLATIIAVIGIVPYISLQLKAVSNSFSIILKYPVIAAPDSQAAIPLLADNTFYIALLLAAFAILFGTRHLDASERHEGLVAAIAFESLVKLLAFIAVGIFATFVTLRRLRGHNHERDRVSADRQAARIQRGIGQLHLMGIADFRLDARNHVPAAPVPDRGSRKRRRAPPQQGGMAVPALPARDQHFRAADCLCRSHAFPGGKHRCRHFRADAADGASACVCDACSCSSVDFPLRPAW